MPAQKFNQISVYLLRSVITADKTPKSFSMYQYSWTIVCNILTAMAYYVITIKLFLFARDPIVR